MAWEFDLSPLKDPLSGSTIVSAVAPDFQRIEMAKDKAPTAA
jgi:hypothetical protein